MCPTISCDYCRFCSIWNERKSWVFVLLITRLCRFCSVVLRRFLAFEIRGRRWSELELKETLKMLYLKRVKRENRQQNRKVAEHVLILTPLPAPLQFQFFLEFWCYMVFIFRWSCLFWYFTKTWICFCLLPDLITWATHRVLMLSLATKQSL